MTPLASYRAPFDEFSGKVGDGPNAIITYSKEGRGIARNHRIPANPKSAHQQAIRGYLTSLGLHYAELTPAEAAAWDGFGARFVRRDRLGREYAMSGLNAYLAVGLPMLQSLPVGEHEPWPVPAVPPEYVPLPAASALAVSANAGGTALVITVTHGVPAGGHVRFRMTGPIESANAKARVSALRSVSTALDNSFALSAGPGELEHPVASPSIAGIVPGSVIGLEAQSFSADFCPGQVLFLRRATVTLTP